MNMNGISAAGCPALWETRKVQQNRSGSGFLNKNKTAAADAADGNGRLEKTQKRLSVYDAYAIMKTPCSGLSADNLRALAKSPAGRVENERYLIENSDEIAGYWHIYDKMLNQSFVFNPSTTTVQTDNNTNKNYIVCKDPFGGLMDVMPADSGLMGTLAQFLNVDGADGIPTFPLNDRYTIEVNAFTGIECLKMKGDEGGGAWLMISDEQQQEKLRELADIYKEKYPGLIKSDGVAMGLAVAEAAGYAVRTENGIIMIACNGLGYRDNADPSRDWDVMYPVEATHMYTEIMDAMTQGYIEGKEVEEYAKWEKYFEERGLEFERVLSDEELADMQTSSDKKFG